MITINKEKIQYAFMVLVGLFFLAILVGIGIYFWQGHARWQGYKNDPDKQRFVTQIEEVLVKDDKTGDDLLVLGNSYYQLGENSLAISAYKKALDTDAKDVAGLNIVNAYIANKDYKLAETELRSILKEKNYADSSLYIKLADLYKLDWKGKKSDTLGTLLEFYEKAPGNVDILNNIAEYYADSGEKDKAIEFYNKSLEVMPDKDSIKQEIERLSKPR